MKTTEEIYEGLLAAFAQRAGFTPEADCDLAVRLYAAAAELQALGIQAEWVLDQSFPQTAQGMYLDYHAQMRGIARTAATSAVGTIRFTVARASGAALTIESGTVCMTADEVRFQTTADAVLEAGELSADAPAEALEAGRSGNAAAGTIRSSPPARWGSPAARIRPPSPAAATRRTTRACAAASWRATSGCPTGPTPPGMSRRP